MEDHIQWHTALVNVANHASTEFYRVKGLVDLFAAKTLGIVETKYLTNTELQYITNYAKYSYLTVSLLLICDSIIYRKFI